MVEHLVANENVASSNLVSRSILEASANAGASFICVLVGRLAGILILLPNEHSIRNES